MNKIKIFLFSVCLFFFRFSFGSETECQDVIPSNLFEIVVGDLSNTGVYVDIYFPPKYKDLKYRLSNFSYSRIDPECVKDCDTREFVFEPKVFKQKPNLYMQIFVNGKLNTNINMTFIYRYDSRKFSCFSRKTFNLRNGVLDDKAVKFTYEK